VAFVGAEHVGTYARVRGDGSWNTTIRDGGTYRAHQPSAETLEVARRARDLFDLAFTSVDVAEGPDGPLVFEVSAFGGYRGLRDALGVDAAARFVDHVLAELARV
jgi:ribosomal protein S6--L-glutamate ligase